MNLRKTLLAGVIAAFIPLAASAQDPTTQSEPGMSSSSTNQGSFKTADTDGDGRISRSEASSDKTMGRQFPKWDRNGDGYLDGTEYGARSRDANASSHLSPDSTSSSQSETSSPSTTPPGQGSPSRGGLPNNSAAAGMGGSFTTLDTNGDKRLSKSEVAADESLSRDFVSTDKNADGYLDNSEYSGRSRTAPTSQTRGNPGSNPDSNNTNPAEGQR
jgi:hypothetical protein